MPPAPSDDDRSSLERELVFFDRVKAKLRNKDTYADLLKCLNMFAQVIINLQWYLSALKCLLRRSSN